MSETPSADNPVTDAADVLGSPIVAPSVGEAESAGRDVSGGVSGGAMVVDRAVRRRAGELIDPFGLRMLVIGWCLWLLVSWSITLAIGVPVHAVRWVVFSAAFGLMAVWPALRLSQQLPWQQGDAADGQDGVFPHKSRDKPSLHVLATLLDWLCLVMVFQVVVWPLMLVGRWSPGQTLWLDLTVVSWSLLTAVLVGLGRVLPTSGARVGAMILCVLLLLGEPVLMALGGGGLWGAISGGGGSSGGGGWQMRISPVQALWELTTTVQPYNPSGWVAPILSAGVAAVLGWIMLCVMARWVRSGSSG